MEDLNVYLGNHKIRMGSWWDGSKETKTKTFVFVVRVLKSGGSEMAPQRAILNFLELFVRGKINLFLYKFLQWLTPPPSKSEGAPMPRIKPNSRK